MTRESNRDADRQTIGQQLLQPILTDRHLPPPWCSRASMIEYGSICDRIYIDHMIFCGEWELDANMDWRPIAMRDQQAPLPLILPHKQIEVRLAPHWLTLQRQLRARTDAILTQHQYDVLMIVMRVCPDNLMAMRSVFVALDDGDYGSTLDRLIKTVRLAMLDHPRTGYMISDVARYWYPLADTAPAAD